MASKGKGKAKIYATLPNSQPTTSSTKQHEGALDNSYFVDAQMKNSSWHRARIIECRLSKDYDIKTKKTESSYEYYIHYEGFNRRMDEWVTIHRIRPLGEIIPEEPPKQKKIKKDEKRGECQENDEHEGMDKQSLILHEQHTKFKTIDQIEFGEFKCETWYYSPFPTVFFNSTISQQGYHNIECLYICEFCLSFFTQKIELTRHQSKCLLTQLGQRKTYSLNYIKAPGDEIYRDPQYKISLFEVDGHKNPTYCENLCYISKLFLDHKNLYYDVEPFLFFILTEFNETDKIGTPERPLSDLGRESYLSWWTQRLIDYIRAKDQKEEITLANIMKNTGIKDSDTLWTLEQKQMIKYQQSTPIICTDPGYLDQIYKKAGRPGLTVKPEALHWVPYKKNRMEPKQEKIDKI